MNCPICGAEGKEIIVTVKATIHNTHKKFNSYAMECTGCKGIYYTPEQKKIKADTIKAFESAFRLLNFMR